MTAAKKVEIEKEKIKEREWVKELCDKIKENLNWKEIAKDYELAYEVSFPHSIALNNCLKLVESGKREDGTSKIKLVCDNTSINENLKEEDVEYWNVDIIVYERTTSKPRVVIEAKYKNINTHDPITYSHKASLHKKLFCGLRYGLIVGNYSEDGTRKDENCYIPNRVFEYGDNFDFILLFKENYDDQEIESFIEVLKENINISKNIEQFYKKGTKYTSINKKIEFK